jgi:hypothetical protein
MKWKWTWKWLLGKVPEPQPDDSKEEPVTPEPEAKPIEPARTQLAEVFPAHTQEMKEANSRLKEIAKKRGVDPREVEAELTRMVHRARGAAFREVIKRGHTQ